LSVALLGVVFVAALFAVPRFGGGVERAQGAGDGVSVAIDMVKDTNWCDTDGAGGDDIDATATHAVGDTYQVAICLTDSPNKVAGFNFNLVYDDVMNTCVDTPCGSDAKCLDSNPDANAGVSVSSTPSLGTVGWNCALDASIVPNCDANTGSPGPGAGIAFLECLSSALESDLTLPVGVGVSAPIAVLTFHANGGGTDTLQLDQLSVIKKGGAEVVACSIDDGSGNCSDGTDIKTGATLTPAPPTNTPLPATATPTPACGRAGSGLPACTPTAKAWTSTPTPGPTETATPAAPSGGGGGGGGNPPPPPAPGGGTGPVVSPPSTGDGSGGVPWATRLIWLMAGLGAISLVSGGLYFRHARMRK
jgi:hypothetical protein